MKNHGIVSISNLKLARDRLQISLLLRESEPINFYSSLSFKGNGS